MMLGMFVVLSMEKCMVSNNPLVDNIGNISDGGYMVLSSAVACNMVLRMEVVKTIYLEKLIHDRWFAYSYEIVPIFPNVDIFGMEYRSIIIGSRLQVDLVKFIELLG
ncbi:hypothetical protein PVK06_034585 [Gossypium arboreum]|uniref:Uncharacterized protein n=1 Tax=Gossypium arboreum TaxID=29729 RepID=A0ABR0NF71_GOSAR|nr:hypothetical protein PVK06_034585 [Gossypium arboreum]